MTTTKRDFKGVWKPKEIWLNEKLSLKEKVFLVEIDSLDNDKGCYASNKYFSEFFQLSKNRCSEIITSLEKKEFISIKYTRKEKQILKRTIIINPIRVTDYPIREIRIPLFGKVGRE